MVTIKIKGHDVELVRVVDAFSRRAIFYKNAIIATLHKLGVNPDQVDIEVEQMAARNLPASASWFMDGHRLHYSYRSASKYVENLQIISKVIELEAEEVLSGRKAMRDFIAEFSEEDDVEEKRKMAREVLGVAPDVLDLDHIDKKFKALARKHHPDMPQGDTETFKKINDAHKILRRELQ